MTPDHFMFNSARMLVAFLPLHKSPVSSRHTRHLACFIPLASRTLLGELHRLAWATVDGQMKREDGEVVHRRQAAILISCPVNAHIKINRGPRSTQACMCFSVSKVRGMIMAGWFGKLAGMSG